ncbi:maleylacetoacetate isomerase [Pseudooceanicola sp. LIPI14-2-Ac024]|uniref:maleylacetoacetate isomerase n=1 Tax=Pseudooceanicola sp. LIPI14-2-Ac024 TaxID=3344875 RepID=UPI0035CF1AAB
MKLLSRSGSSAAYRCRIALNLKGIDAEVVNLRDGEFYEAPYLAINPQGRIPTLITDDGPISQSMAILEYLDEVQPAPPFLPTAPIDRAHARAVAQIVVADVHPLQNSGTLRLLAEDHGIGAAGQRSWAQTWIARGLAACEALLTREDHGGSYAFGATPGLADICIVPQMRNAGRFSVDTTCLPRLTAITAACLEHPAFAAAHPDRHPDPDAK